MAKIEGIAVKAKPKAVMSLLNSAVVTVDKGVANDARGKSGKRQVSILSQQQWELACEELGVVLPWTTRRANILVSGVEFSAANKGKIIAIGKLRMRVSGETDPCIRMEQAQAGLFDALRPDWRGGVVCEVLSPGEIQLGDTLEILSDELDLR